jgi:co-chaperonin GroES (HSP10)
MQVLNKNVLVVPTVDETVQEGGIFIPQTAVSLTYGVVANVGPEVEDVTEGDKVLLPKGELMEVDYKGTKYIIIPEDAIVAIV